MKKRDPVVSLAQIRYFDINKKNNVEKIKKFIRLAKSRNSDIVCFPESCIHKTDTLSFDDKFVNEIREECKKNSIWCIITEDFYLKKKPYNLALLIDRKGEIQGNYKKIHLYGDSENLRAGKKTRVFKTDFAKIGIIICWDLAFPELFQKMKRAGAQIVFCPAAWCYEEKSYKDAHLKEETRLLRSLVRARAYENLYYVCLTNPLINRKDIVSYSAISSPQKIIKESIKKEGLITAKIDLSLIPKLRKLYSKSK